MEIYQHLDFYCIDKGYAYYHLEDREGQIYYIAKERLSQLPSYLHYRVWFSDLGADTTFHKCENYLDCSEENQVKEHMVRHLSESLDKFYSAHHEPHKRPFDYK